MPTVFVELMLQYLKLQAASDTDTQSTVFDSSA